MLRRGVADVDARVGRARWRVEARRVWRRQREQRRGTKSRIGEGVGRIMSAMCLVVRGNVNRVVGEAIRVSFVGFRDDVSSRKSLGA